MSSRQTKFDPLYPDRLGTHRVPTSFGSVWDRVQDPSVLLSGLFVLVTVLYHLYGSSDALEFGFFWLASCIWDTFVYLTPSALIDFIDAWFNSLQTPRPMQTAPRPSTHAEKSAAMQRLMGLDARHGMMATVFQARSRSMSMSGVTLGFKADVAKPPGLGNRDNSCFQNSILQGLASLDTFPEYLSNCLKYAGASADKEATSAVAQTLQALLTDLNSTSNNGRTLWTPHGLRFMSTWTQQDAQEYYSKILDDIDKGAATVLRAAKPQSGLEAQPTPDDTTSSQHSDDSGYQSLPALSKASEALAFRNPLEGLLAQRVACVQCGYSEGLSMIPFNCLTLSLGLKGREHDLYERLDAYSDIEPIEGVECPKCTLLKAQRLLTKLVESMREKTESDEQLAEPLRRLEAIEAALEEDHFDERTLSETCKISPRSKVTTTKTKQVVIARPPQSLAIHVNRSVFDPSTFHTIKNSAPVRFPTTLDLGPWCLGSAGSTGQSETEETACETSDEQWQLDPTASMVAGDLKASKVTGPIYELRAVVTHAGRHENGHYICYRKYPRASPSKSINEGTSKDANEIDEDRDNPEEREQGAVNLDNSELDWWRLSDHDVSKVDEETVSNLGHGVFMLFYDCIDSAMVHSTESDIIPTSASGAEISHSEDTSSATDSAGTEASRDTAVQSGPGDAYGLATTTPLPSGNENSQDPRRTKGSGN